MDARYPKTNFRSQAYQEGTRKNKNKWNDGKKRWNQGWTFEKVTWMKKWLPKAGRPDPSRTPTQERKANRPQWNRHEAVDKRIVMSKRRPEVKGLAEIVLPDWLEKRKQSIDPHFANHNRLAVGRELEREPEMLWKTMQVTGRRTKRERDADKNARHYFVWTSGSQTLICMQNSVPLWAAQKDVFRTNEYIAKQK